MTWEPEVEEIARRRMLAQQMGGEERIADQRARGKLTVRERIDLLLDEGSFDERGGLAGSGDYVEGVLADFRSAAFVMGVGEVDGRPIAVGGGDFTARARPTSEGRTGNKSDYAEKMAIGLQVPLVRLIDGFGADIRAVGAIGRMYVPGSDHYRLYGEVLATVPCVSAALGAVAGLPAAQMGLAHFSIMVKEVSQIFAAGPPVVKRALGVDVSKEELGGWRVHATSGLVHNVADDEQDAFRQIRRFLSYLPTSVWQLPPVCASDDPPDRRAEELLSIIPRDRRRPYDVRRMIGLIVDEGSFFEMGRLYGSSQVTGLARIAGYPVGILANDPLKLGGSMDAAAAQKGERFVDFCDTFHLPVVNLFDQPGFMIGAASERSGTLHYGGRFAAALISARVPWATVIVRRAYGVAGALHQDHSRYNPRVAWPSLESGSIPIEGGVRAAHRREIEAAPDPQAKQEELERELIALRSSFRTAEAFNIEDIIDPRDTRPMLAAWLKLTFDQLQQQLGPKPGGTRP